MLGHRSRRTMSEDIYHLLEEQSVELKALWPGFPKELARMIEVGSLLATKISDGASGPADSFGC